MIYPLADEECVSFQHLPSCWFVQAMSFQYPRWYWREMHPLFQHPQMQWVNEVLMRWVTRKYS